MKVTCISIGVYPHALTRGKTYEIISEKDGMYQIEGDSTRRAWISSYHFLSGEVSIPMLTGWQFDDDIDTDDLIEVTMTFSDGSKRWCVVSTPAKLAHHFAPLNLDPPGFNMHHLIIMRSLSSEDIDRTLRCLEDQNELDQASLAYDGSSDMTTE